MEQLKVFNLKFRRYDIVLRFGIRLFPSTPLAAVVLPSKILNDHRQSCLNIRASHYMEALHFAHYGWDDHSWVA